MMSRVYTKMTDLIGRTPLLELTRVEEAEELKASLLVKLESFNPAGSARDRIAKAMIEDAEARACWDRARLSSSPQAVIPASAWPPWQPPRATG